MEIIIGEQVKDNTFAHKRIEIPDSEIDHILDVFEGKIKIRATDLQKVHNIGYNEGYTQGYTQGYLDGIGVKQVSSERPHGKWIKLRDYDFKCSLCGLSIMDEYNYCPECGADMREDADNETHDKTEGMH